MSDMYDLFELDALNPLIARLPSERTLMEWADALKFDPRSRSRRNAGRIPESHAHAIAGVVVPTTLSVEVAVTIFTMMIVSLRRRDPRLAENRRALFEFAEWKRGKLGPDLRDLPYFGWSASGSILRGPTGCAKTHTINALFRILPQVIEHGPLPECGWIFLKQLVYLRVEMPADATRNGLLFGIVEAVDKALGSSYAKELHKRRTIEERLVEVLHILMVHRCGVLVLDETQVRNVAPLVLGSEFVALFLRVLNCGIPLVLVGNPLAFEHVLNFSQDLRRFTEGGLFDFFPFYDHLDAEWRNLMVPGLWRWNLFTKNDPATQGLEELLYERTGGIHDLLARYRRESIICAIRSGADCVTRTHMDAAFKAPSMKGMHKLVDAYVHKDLELLASFSDQPLSYLEDFWNAMRMVRARSDAPKRQATAQSAVA